MATDVVMPQMGESVAEGTIVRWIKKVGDKVERDEPLFEISTDKVDAEIPAPAAGVVTAIQVQEGETVAVNTVVAIIGEAAGAPAPTPAPPPQDASAQPQHPAARPSAKAPVAEAVGGQAAAGGRREAAEGERREPPTGSSVESVIRQRSSPLVRRIAREHNVDISQLHGTGIAGRVTKSDILGYLAQEGREEPEKRERQERAAPRPSQPGRVAAAGQFGVPGHTEKMSVMRKKIAEHMVLSRRTSAHVHSVFEVNFSRVAKTREAAKADYERAGTKLTFLSYIARAVVDSLRAVPIVNASLDGDTIVYHQDINLGIAVALDWGLIVPVIKHADEKNLLGLSRAIADLAGRARAKQLKPEDVTGGTFTITNPGVFGALFGMPIINQPQLAILGVGNIEKRPVVIDDAIAIRPMAYLTLGYDHRLIDGAVADQFMSHLKHLLENWDDDA